MSAAFDPEVHLFESGQRWFFGTTFPALASDTNGVTMQAGDFILNKSPSAANPTFGWECIATGNPGTWRAIGGSSGSQFGLTGEQVAHAQYSFANDGGADSTITILNNATIPINAIITNVVITVSTAVVGAGASIAIGTSAGSSSTALLGATAITSFTSGAKLQGTPVPQTNTTWVKMTAAGQITVTPSAAVLTAGIFDIFVYFVIAAA